MKGRLQLRTAFRSGSTVVADLYYAPPYKLVQVSKPGVLLHLVLMCASPGILDGDNYEMEVDVAEGTRVYWTTPSFQRLFAMKKGARHQMQVRVRKGAAFYCVSYPLVPQAGSVFSGMNSIYLDENAILFWSEIITSGRGGGEQFLFTRFQSKTEIFYSGKIIVRENLVLYPSEVNLQEIGQLEGFTHQATIFFIHPGVQFEELNQELFSFLKDKQQIEFGITRLQVNGICIRILGYKGEQLYDAVQQLRQHLVAVVTKEPKLEDHAV